MENGRLLPNRGGEKSEEVPLWIQTTHTANIPDHNHVQRRFNKVFSAVQQSVFSGSTKRFQRLVTASISERPF